MQRRITRQRDAVREQRLHDDMLALPDGDMRREAYMECGELSMLFFCAMPSEGRRVEQRHWCEAYSLLLGLPSPASAEAGVVGRQFSDISGRAFVVDAYGVELSRRLLPDGLHQRQSRATERAILRPIIAAGVAGREQPSAIFSGVLPQPALEAEDGRRQLERRGIVPDGVLSLPGLFPSVTTRAQRAAALREFLAEVKNIHDDTEWYRRARVAMAGGAPRGRAADLRAGAIHRDYELRAMALDRTHHGVQVARGADGRQVPVGGPGPVLRRLREYPPVQGLVVGPRADTSAALLTLIAVAARAAAGAHWRLMGAQRAEDAQSFLAGTLRRDLAMAVIRAEAQLRVERARRMRRWDRGERVWAAVDVDEDDPIAEAVDDFDRGLEPAAAAHVRR